MWTNNAPACPLTQAQAEFWRRFLASSGMDANTPCFEAFHFCTDERLANALLELVLEGKKRATTSSLAAWEAEERMPLPGQLSIVTDFAGRPRCVIRTNRVTVLPFCEVDFETCRREGEDDCLETWQEGHRKYLRLDAGECGFEFSEDMNVVFEDFTMIYAED